MKLFTNWGRNFRSGIFFLLIIGMWVWIEAEPKYPTNSKESKIMSLLQNRLLKPFNNRAAEIPRRNNNQPPQGAPHLLNESVDTVWVRKFAGPGGGDAYPWPHAIAVDNSGNVYVGGASSGIGTLRDYTIIKYDSNGNEKWVARYDDNNNDDVLRAMTIDDSGSVYVTGISGPTEPSNMTTIKYNSDGCTLWVRHHTGAGGFLNYGNAIAVDESGNVYVTGFETGPMIDGNIITIKYDKTGHVIWQAIYDTPGTDMDFAESMDIALDNAGNIYVGGYYTPDLGSTDFLIIKYSPAGETLWTRLYHGDGFFNYLEHIAVDDSGNCYVSGYTYVLVSQRYDPDGHLLWSSDSVGLNIVGSSSDLQIDNHGGIVVAGLGGYGNGGLDYLTIKFNASNGDTIWRRTHNGPANWNDYLWDMAIDNDNNIYVTGCACGPVCEKEYCTVKYDGAGNELWAVHYFPPNTYGYNIGYAVAVDDWGYVYVTGEADTSGNGAGPIVTIKYRQLPVGVVEHHATNMPTSGLRITNPIKDNMIVYLPDNFYGHMTLSLYDVAGTLVKNFKAEITEQKRQINLSVKELPYGIYFLQVNAETNIWTAKVVKIE